MRTEQHRGADPGGKPGEREQPLSQQAGITDIPNQRRAPATRMRGSDQRMHAAPTSTTVRPADKGAICGVALLFAAGVVAVTSQDEVVIAVFIVALLVIAVAAMALHESAERMRVTTDLLVGQQRAENSTT